MSDLSKLNNIPMLIDVIPTGYLSLSLKFDYSNDDYDYTIDMIAGNKYDIVYVENRELKRAVGVLRNVTKVYTYDNDDCSCGCDCSGGCSTTSTSCGTCGVCNSGGLDGSTAEYLLDFDCSSDFSCNKVRVKTSQLRSVTEYVPYADDGTKITNASSDGGTTTGKITKVEIKDGEVDPDHNKAIGGDVVDGDVDPDDGKTDGGVVDGNNENGNHITIVDGVVYGGKIKGGTLISADIVPGTYTLISGTKNDSTGRIENAHYTADLINVVIINSIIENGTTDGTDGRVIDITMTNPIVFNGTVNDPNSETTKGTTIGTTTYNGITKGIVYGGTAYGIIDNRPAVLTGDIVTKGSVTSGGITTGGTSIGGTTRDDVTTGNTIIGGKTTGGTSYGGVTTGGKVSFDTSKIRGDISDIIGPRTIDNSKKTTTKTRDGLIVSTDPIRGVRSNIADPNANITPTIQSLGVSGSLKSTYDVTEGQYYTTKSDIDKLFDS